MMRSSTIESSSKKAYSICLISQPFQSLGPLDDWRFVDKTSAIADILVNKSLGSASGIHQRLFFCRPRKFGKSLTLDIAATMLRAGDLPSGVSPWRHRTPVDVEKVFGKTSVFKRFQERDPSLQGLLRNAHFVIQLDLVSAESGEHLRQFLINQIADIALREFGDHDLKSDILGSSYAGEALAWLIENIPREVPVSILVDEYDTPILNDVGEKQWDSARAGIKALQSLLSVSKSHTERIHKFVVTGVTRFSLANNFVDITNGPLLSKAIGLSREEIKETFPDELEALAENSDLESSDKALDLLGHHFDGHCFDNETTCFDPFPVLSSLSSGKIETNLNPASSASFGRMGLSGNSLFQMLVTNEDRALTAPVTPKTIEIADLRRENVNVVGLLLQTGMLTLVPGAEPPRFKVPNETARVRMARLLASPLVRDFSSRVDVLCKAFCDGDIQALPHKLVSLMEHLPYEIAQSGKVERESSFHASFFMALLVGLHPSQFKIIPEISGAGIVVENVQLGRVWIFKVGLGSDPKDKLQQAERCAHRYTNQLTGAAEVVGGVERTAKRMRLEGGSVETPRMEVALCAVIFEKHQPASREGPCAGDSEGTNRQWSCKLYWRHKLKDGHAATPLKGAHAVATSSSS